MIVESGALAVQGTSNANTTFIVNHYGDIDVNGGNFSLARGSQGSGSGTTAWFLYNGNLSLANSTIQNSNPTAGNAKFVFAKKDTQKVSFDNVTYGGGGIHFEVADTAVMQITTDLTVNGLLVNHGAVDPMGVLTFANGSVYDHARDAGSIPTDYLGSGIDLFIDRYPAGCTGEPDPEFLQCHLQHTQSWTQPRHGLDW